jgi:ATP-binding cassette subfamily F protein uup
MAYQGTVLLISHDRAFLDNVVTDTWAFMGNSVVEEFVGGYQDWLRQTSNRSVKKRPTLQLSRYKTKKNPQTLSKN